MQTNRKLEFIKKYYPDLSQETRSGELLKLIRNRKGLTQDELATKINAYQTHICQMEKGTRPIGRTISYRLAKVFKIHHLIFLEVKRWKSEK